jgi:hypothetical protein
MPMSFASQNKEKSDQVQRVKLMDMINPMPQRDQEEEGKLKKRAKWNAVGQAVGALGQLGGMAAGGDAVAIQDNVSPFITDRLQYLDNDYRNRLQRFGVEAFQTGMYNNELENRDLQAQRDADLKRELQEEKGKNALELFMQKSKAEQDKEMRNAGVDPSDPKAKQKYIAAKGRQFNSDINYKDRIGRGRAGSGPDDQEDDTEFVRISRIARGKKLEDLRSQMQELQKNPMMNAEMIKVLNDQIKAYEGIRLKKDNQQAVDLYESEINAPQQQQYDPNYMKGAQWSYQPGQGLIPMTPQVEQQLFQSIQPILQGDYSNVDAVISQLIRTGVAANEEEAEEKILDLIEAIQNGR